MENHQFISLIIASFVGKAEKVASEVRRLGGEIQYQEDDIGYLRVIVPKNKVQQLIDFGEIEAVMVNASNREVIGLDGRTSLQGTALSNLSFPEETGGEKLGSKWPPELSDYPLLNPYHPWEDLDAKKFLEENPSYDGRGVVIGQVEDFGDLLLNELHWSININGNKVKKVIDVINATDPLDGSITNSGFDHHETDSIQTFRRTNNADLRWVDMKQEVISNQRRVNYNDNTYEVPQEGFYRIGLLELRGRLKRELKKIGVEVKSSGQMAVLWDANSDVVWVDTNSNNDFSDEIGLNEYRIKQEIGVWGIDNPTTELRESIGFAVQIDKNNEFISINDGVGIHETMVAGSAVASDTFGGRVKGIAPNSQLISISYNQGSKTSNYLEALILAFKDKRIDIVLIEPFSGQTFNLYYLRDGSSVIDIIQERLLKKYPKLCVNAASNYDGLAQITDHSVSKNILSTGAYQSREAILTNFGIKGAPIDDLHTVSSNGPGGNGALKPNFLAPSYMITTAPGFFWDSSTLKSLYRLPPGYLLGGGTSQSTPVAAGAIALLASALKQNGNPIKVDAIKSALLSTAKYIPKLKAHQQGNGLLQVNAAWEKLRQFKIQAEPIQIDIEADVKTVSSHLNATPNKGEGLFEQEGWEIGMNEERLVTLKRTNGDKAPMVFEVNWQGNDGTFSGPDKIVLPLNIPVAYPIKIKANSTGAHSALLVLDCLDYPGIEKKVLNTIVVPEKLDASNNYQIKKRDSLIRPNGKLHYFLKIPSGIGLFQCKINTENVFFRAISPDKTVTVSGKNKKGKKEISVNRPMAGTWEIIVKESTIVPEDFLKTLGSSLPNQPLELEFSIQNAQIEQKSSDIVTGTDKTSDKSIMYRNLCAPFKGMVTGSSIGARRRVNKKIKAKEQHRFEIDIESGTSSLLVYLEVKANSKSDLDLILIDPKGRISWIGLFYQRENFSSHRQQYYSSEEELFVENPIPGTWKVIVDGFFIPNGEMEYTLSDIIQHPKYGSLSTSDFVKEHGIGETWSFKSKVWLNEKTDYNRKPVGVLQVEKINSDPLKKRVVIARNILEFEK